VEESVCCLALRAPKRYLNLTDTPLLRSKTGMHMPVCGLALALDFLKPESRASGSAGKCSQATKTASGIVLPESAAEKPDKGEVLAVGPGRRDTERR